MGPFASIVLNYRRVVSIEVAIHLVDPNLHQSSNDSRSASDLGHAAFILEAETAMFAKAETLWRPEKKGWVKTSDQKGSFEVANLSFLFLVQQSVSIRVLYNIYIYYIHMFISMSYDNYIYI